MDLSQLFWEDQDEDRTAEPGATAVREACRMGPRRKLFRFEMTLSEVWLQSAVPGIAIFKKFLIVFKNNFISLTILCLSCSMQDLAL